MAGIGFELKKLFNGKSYSSTIRAYIYSAFVTVGPTIICISLITVFQGILANLSVAFAKRELFTAAISYSFVFSLLVTSGFTMIISRYISDKLYKKKNDDIIVSLYGVLSVCLPLGGILGIVFYWHSPLDFFFKLIAYLLYMELIVIWVQAVYLSALKDYRKIMKGFFYCVIISALCILGAIKLLSLDPVISILASLDIGMFVIIISFMRNIGEVFKPRKNKYFEFLVYLDRHPFLFFVSFFYTLGLYIHNFTFWHSSIGVSIGSTYVYAPLYDVASFYAFLTIIPTMVIFVVKIETSFYEKYNEYYSLILGKGDLQDISTARNEMTASLFTEIKYIMETQLVISLIGMVLGMKFLPRIGVMGLALDNFTILVLACYACVMMFIIMLIQLYFDDQNGAVTVAAVFLLGTAIFTRLSIVLGENYYGMGFFMAAFIALGVSLLRLIYFLRNIDYYTFCSQPIIFREKEGFFTWLIKKFYKDEM